MKRFTCTPRIANTLFLAFIIASSAVGQETANNDETALVLLKEFLSVDHPIIESFAGRGLRFDGKKVTLNERRGREFAGPLRVTGQPQLIEEFANVLQASQMPHSVEITVHMIEASRAASNIDVPDSLGAVVDTLKETFGYPNFKLLETVLVRTVSGSEDLLTMSGTLPTSIEFHEDLESKFSLFYGIQTGTVNLDAIGDLWNIGIELFHCSFEVPFLNVRITGEETAYHLEYRDVGVSTALQLREGQQVVVGKSNVKSSSDALFIVVSAKVVE